MPETPAPFPPNEPRYKSVEEAAKIYLLPNLFTAGNMLFGFKAMLKCIDAKFTHAGDAKAAFDDYRWAVYFILIACIFDVFDGLVARASKRVSLFGAEFDSIADTVSFGVAPAFLVYFLILDPVKDAGGLINGMMADFGWVFAFIYLLCVGVRLAKFNVITNPLVPGSDKRNNTGEFMGLPSPAAAGMTASIVLLLTNGDPGILRLKPLLLPLMLLISYIMVSNIPYPSIKRISWKTVANARVFIGIIVVGVLAVNYFLYALPVFFLGYIFFGIGRDIRRRFFMKKEDLAKEDIPDDEF